MRQKIKELLDAVKKLEAESARSARESKFAADEASGGLVASYSAAGDAEHARNTANLSIQKYESIKKLARELESAVALNAPSCVQSVCFVKIEMLGDIKEFYLVDNPVFISGLNIISPISPIGKALLNKKAGDLFLYKIRDQNLTGKILEIK